VTIHADLNREREPSLDAYMHQPKFGVENISVVAQALAHSTPLAVGKAYETLAPADRQMPLENYSIKT